MNPDSRSIPSVVRRLLLLLMFIFAAPAFSGPGHDGGHEEEGGQPVAVDSVEPRFEAHSDLFEVVGILNSGALVLSLDTYATNEPVSGAQVELESGSYKATGEFDSDRGLYRFADVPFSATGTYPVTLTITAGNEVDLLAADLIVRPASAASASASVMNGTPSSGSWLWWGVGGVGAIAALAFGLRRRRAVA